ncbi:MAG: DUF3501 family protein [Pseudomonadota bacterium]|nr:DUF3501 family protein [Pseudomonadota bacterium]
MENLKKLTFDHILPYKKYAAGRKESQISLSAIKKNRRMEVGPHAMFYFENYETMWFQVHEMLHIERGGEAQIPEELAAYNPLIPQGRELIATVMLEIGEPVKRAKILGVLGGIENTAFICVQGELINGIPEIDLDRTNSDGKASSVHFIHFPFSNKQIKTFRSSNADIVVGFRHEYYTHSAGMPGAVRKALRDDFD